jgi:hypothetical protein
MQQYHLLIILSHVEVLCAMTAFAMPAFRVLLLKKFWSRKHEQIEELSGLSVGRRRFRRAIGTDTELLQTSPATSVVVRSPTRTTEVLEDMK